MWQLKKNTLLQILYTDFKLYKEKHAVMCMEIMLATMCLYTCFVGGGSHTRNTEVFCWTYMYVYMFQKSWQVYFSMHKQIKIKWIGKYFFLMINVDCVPIVECLYMIINYIKVFYHKY